MLFKTRSAAVYGIDAIVEVEVDGSRIRTPEDHFTTVGRRMRPYGKAVTASAEPLESSSTRTATSRLRSEARWRPSSCLRV
jgi:hypothetical protein